MLNDRNKMIDYIEEFWNNEENWPDLDEVYIKMFGQMDDNGEEGIYTNLSNTDLANLIDALEALDDGRRYSLELSEEEFDVVRQAMEDFSDSTFTKDREMSRIAKLVLRKLNAQRI